MKNLLIVFLLISFSVNSCGQKTKSIQGAWELISGKYGMPDNTTERNQPDKPFQIKLFANKHFAYIMQKPDGSFEPARAGTYTIQGDQYIETHKWKYRLRIQRFYIYFYIPVTGGQACDEGPCKSIGCKRPGNKISADGRSTYKS